MIESIDSILEPPLAASIVVTSGVEVTSIEFPVDVLIKFPENEKF